MRGTTLPVSGTHPPACGAPLLVRAATSSCQVAAGARPSPVKSRPGSARRAQAFFVMSREALEAHLCEVLGNVPRVHIGAIGHCLGSYRIRAMRHLEGAQPQDFSGCVHLPVVVGSALRQLLTRPIECARRGRARRVRVAMPCEGALWTAGRRLVPECYPREVSARPRSGPVERPALARGSVEGQRANCCRFLIAKEGVCAPGVASWPDVHAFFALLFARPPGRLLAGRLTG